MSATDLIDEGSDGETASVLEGLRDVGRWERRRARRTCSRLLWEGARRGRIGVARTVVGETLSTSAAVTGGNESVVMTRDGLAFCCCWSLLGRKYSGWLYCCGEPGDDAESIEESSVRLGSSETAKEGRFELIVEDAVDGDAEAAATALRMLSTDGAV